MTVAVSRAKGGGAEAIICASTGNTAASCAAYAARAGLRGAVIVPEGRIAIGKLAQALMHGARVIALRGQLRPGARDRPRAGRSATPSSWSTRSIPYRIEGQKTARVRGLRRARRAPRRARDTGRQRRQHHRLVARLSRVRGSAAAVRLPGRGRGAARARQAGAPSRRRSPRRSGSATRLAGRRRWTRSPLREGRIAAVSDQQILDAYHLLASREGVFCEPASAASVAGILAHGLPAPEGGERPSRSSACSPVTGSRTPTPRSARRPSVIGCEAELGAVERSCSATTDPAGDRQATAESLVQGANWRPNLQARRRPFRRLEA